MGVGGVRGSGDRRGARGLVGSRDSEARVGGGGAGSSAGGVDAADVGGAGDGVGEHGRLPRARVGAAEGVGDRSIGDEGDLARWILGRPARTPAAGVGVE